MAPPRIQALLRQVMPALCPALLALAVFLGVLGLKLSLIERYGSDLPYWDAWDGEADLLFRPSVEGHIPGAVWLSAHNEHRILFTRLLAFGLFKGNGGHWDARIELVANACLAAAVASALVMVLAGSFGTLQKAALGAASVGLYGASLSYENTLAGFQSQFYFLLLVPGAHLWASTTAREWSSRWWLSFVLGLASLVTMASGLLSSSAVVMVIALYSVQERRLSPARITMMAANLLLFGLGWMLQVDRDYHDFLKAPTPWAWADAFLHQLAWPSSMMAIAILPCVILGLTLFSVATGRGGVSLRMLAAFCLWGWLQCAAIAYARGGVDHGYASRYTDILSVTVLVNGVLGVHLAGQLAPGWARRALVAAIGLYSVAVVWGISREEAIVDREDLEPMRSMNEDRLTSVRDFLREPTPGFYKREPWTQLPYPSAERLATLLSNPAIRSILPPSVMTPPALRIDPGASSGFVATSPPKLAGQPPEDTPCLACGAGDCQLLSEPFEIRLPVAYLFAAAQGPQAEISLELVDDSGQSHSPEGSVSSLGPHWKRFNFMVAPGRYRLAARYRGPGWLAVSSVKDRTLPSHLAEKFTHAGPSLLLLAALALVGSLASGRISEARGDPTLSR